MSLAIRRSMWRSLQSRQLSNRRYASTISSQANELSNKASEASGGNKRADMGGSVPKDKSFLQKGAKRDPELYVNSPLHLRLGRYMLTIVEILLGIMSGAFGLAGYFFSVFYSRRPPHEEADEYAQRTSRPRHHQRHRWAWQRGQCHGSKTM